MTTITIERTILDRLIEVWDSTVLPTHRDGMMQERMEDLRAELAKPARCAQCGYQYGHQIGCVNNPVDIALSKQAIRAELAKPAQEESFIPDWANYRQGVADGKAGNPKWHDVPTEPGLWFNSINHYAELVSQHWIDRGVVANSHARWYGPIPQDIAKEERTK